MCIRDRHLNRPDDPLLSGVREGDFVYYVHSFYATGCGEALAASSEYGGVTVAVSYTHLFCRRYAFMSVQNTP